MFVNGIILAALNRVKEDFGGLLNALEEGIVFSATSCCLLVWMMTEDLLAVGALDLFFGSLVSVLRETKDCVVILSLGKVSKVHIGGATNIPSSLWHRERASLGLQAH